MAVKMHAMYINDILFLQNWHQMKYTKQSIKKKRKKKVKEDMK